ncbi:hypothetical protein TNCV_3036791 [Trichonephila clavipes]|uniref:Uncharacterized protein n=1 Tax=Trichonephila clavipes TaxID=2585209 RepID=A0A8X6WH29_TRICX|nr:hypothetical protein TNCV_3036791 [Trichonephila clavipes]
MLNEQYVDDLINSTSDATEALQLSEEMIHILGEAGMNLRRWATNSTTLYEAWKRANINCRKTSEKSGVQLKILGIIWDNVNGNLNFDIRQSEKLNNFMKADICHSYQILKNHGIPDEGIIVLMTDDVANKGENLTPGIVINLPNGNDVTKVFQKTTLGHTYLEDSYSVHWMEDSDQKVQTTETLQKPVFVPKVEKDYVRSSNVYIEMVMRKLNSEEKQSVLMKKLNQKDST